MKKKRGLGRPRKIDNPDLVPRKPSELPDLERVTAQYMPTIEKICHDIKKNFYKQVHVPNLRDEVFQTVMLEYYIFWDWYKRGVIDKFPPTSGYLYVTAWRKFLGQFCPQDDITRCKIFAYNTLEMGGDITIRGNIIFKDPLYREIASQEQQIPFSNPDSNPNPDYDELFGQIPDIMDFWFLGFSIYELGMIYNLHPETIKLRLHALYDAVEAAGAKTFRPRPKRRKRRTNPFKLKKNRK